MFLKSETNRGASLASLFNSVKRLSEEDKSLPNIRQTLVKPAAVGEQAGYAEHWQGDSDGVPAVQAVHEEQRHDHAREHPSDKAPARQRCGGDQEDGPRSDDFAHRDRVDLGGASEDEELVGKGPGCVGQAEPDKPYTHREAAGPSRERQGCAPPEFLNPLNHVADDTCNSIRDN